VESSSNSLEFNSSHIGESNVNYRLVDENHRLVHHEKVTSLTTHSALETRLTLTGFKGSWYDNIHSDDHFEQFGHNLISWTTVSWFEVLVNFEEIISWGVKL
jgi:hypothetical protein